MIPFDEIQSEVFQLLKSRLPAYLTYHSPGHTEYVLEKAIFISQEEKISQKDQDLVRIAALFHDIGFIRQYKDHEVAGCDITREMLADYSLDPADMDQICGMIMATKISTVPITLNEKIVTDADLEYLGTDLFYPVSQLLFREMQHLDPSLNEEAFRDIQISFISNHIYYTDYCKQHREQKKAENLRLLIEGV